MEVPVGLEPRTGWVAGLNHGAHDASCALLRDGDLVVTVEQERLSRNKRALNESPALALQYCLNFAGIELEDLDVVALGSHHDLLAQWMGYGDQQRRSHLPFDSPSWLYPEDLFGGQRRPPLLPVRHHLAHAASCFWPSGLEECGILIMDAMGEDCSTSLAYGGAEGIEVLETYPVDVSLGFFYESACEYAGLGRQNAGKLMGLAAYGEPAAMDVGLRYKPGQISWPVAATADLTGRELIESRIDQLLEFFKSSCFPYTVGCAGDPLGYAHFAASVQKSLEDVVLGLARRVQALTGSSNLAIAGGVGLNCSANGKVATSGLYENVWVQPMAHDAGVAYGAALVVARALGLQHSKKSQMNHAYWGPPTDEAEAAAELAVFGLEAERMKPDTLLKETAAIIAAGGIVAWHQGRAEVGPRALGARSLLGDPRSRRTLVRLNRMKRREMWRPLAPSVLAERFTEFFEGVPNEFMIVAAHVRPDKRHAIPAVVHVDGSARPQSVLSDNNPLYAGLIAEFEHLTGVPVLVNTSLNVAEEPLCSSPRDSIQTFLKCGADALVLGPYLVRSSSSNSGH